MISGFFLSLVLDGGSLSLPHSPEVSRASLLPGDESGREKGCWKSFQIEWVPKGLSVKGRASCFPNPRDGTAAPHRAQRSPRLACCSPVSPGPGRRAAVGRAGAQPRVGLPSFPQLVPPLPSAGVLSQHLFQMPEQAMTADNQAEIGLSSQVKVSWTEPG